MNQNSMFSDKILPYKLCGISHCFRREAGGGGEKAGGLYRLHQFTKLELVEICHSKDSLNEFKSLIDLQTKLYDSLDISYRVLNMPTGIH